MFFDKFVQLCNDKNISCRKAVSEIGLANSIATKWKKTGATPNSETLKKIADYFGVSVSYLLEEKENDQHAMSDVDRELFNRISAMTDEDKLLMLDMISAIIARKK